MTPIYEADVESWVMSLLQEQATPLSPEEHEAGRDGFSNVLLRRRRSALQRRALPEFRPRHIRRTAVRAVGIRVVFRARLV